MSKVLKDSLIRKNRHMYKTALNAIERVMGKDFRFTEQFNAVRNLILNTGNEIERSISSELDQYAIVLKDGATPAKISAGEYVLSLLPNIEFSRIENEDHSVPTMKMTLSRYDSETHRHEEGNLSLLREILGCGIAAKDKKMNPVFEVVGVADCLKVIPVMTEVIRKAPPKYRQAYNQWVQGVYSDYREVGV